MRTRAARWLRAYAPLVGATSILAAWTIARVFARTGEPSVPLDDSFIHFGYARSFATLRPLVYVPGDPPTSGATSLLWALLLAPFWAIGFRGTSIIWIAWALGFVLLALLALETRRLAAGLTTRSSSLAAGAMVLALGGYTWAAGSGMEIILFAFCLVRTARLGASFLEAVRPSPVRTPERNADAEGLQWLLSTLAPGNPEPQPPLDLRRLRVELCVFGALVALARPEGAFMSLLAAAALAAAAPRRYALVPIAGAAFSTLFLRVVTGSFSSSGAQTKWLPLNPYHRGDVLYEAILERLRAIFGLFLDGRLRNLSAIPEGFAVVAFLGLAAVALAGWRRRRPFHAASVVVLALALALPSTFDSFEATRCRYLWPFAAAWLVGLAALADLVGDLARRVSPGLGAVRAAVAWGIVLAFATRLPVAIDDLARCSDEIRRQQVSLARWVRDNLPEDARIGLNDAGAIPYLSGRRSFDIVGLTSPGEAKYWIAGAGSRFEHYERLGAAALPRYFVVYEPWFKTPALLGAKLTERTVTDASILGGDTAVVHEADYAVLGSGEMPSGITGAIVDVLDVADLESEAEHGYELLDATFAANLPFGDDRHVDGGRAHRSVDRFQLALEPDGKLVLRLASVEAGGTPARIRIDGKTVAEVHVEPGSWREYAIDIGTDVVAGRHSVEVTAAPARTFVSLHYWSFGRSAKITQNP